MTDTSRSGCPINLSLEVLGDRWSLLIIRDMMFGNRRHFRELLTKSEEGISSNILADRLKTLLDENIITREDDPTHKQKGIYSLTEQGIELLPVLAQMAAWGYKYLPVSKELGIHARLELRDPVARWRADTIGAALHRDQGFLARRARPHRRRDDRRPRERIRDPCEAGGRTLGPR